MTVDSRPESRIETSRLCITGGCFASFLHLCHVAALSYVTSVKTHTQTHTNSRTAGRCQMVTRCAYREALRRTCFMMLFRNGNQRSASGLGRNPHECRKRSRGVSADAVLHAPGGNPGPVRGLAHSVRKQRPRQIVRWNRIAQTRCPPIPPLLYPTSLQAAGVDGDDQTTASAVPHSGTPVPVVTKTPPFSPLNETVLEAQRTGPRLPAPPTCACVHTPWHRHVRTLGGAASSPNSFLTSSKVRSQRRSYHTHMSDFRVRRPTRNAHGMYTRARTSLLPLCLALVLLLLRCGYASE